MDEDTVGPSIPWAGIVTDLLGAAERAVWCARALVHMQLGPEALAGRTTKKDFCDALYHLDQLKAERLNIHRVELERILLEAVAERDAEERLMGQGA